MNCRITGKTRIIAHIGVPTDNFTAPMIYNPWLASQGIDTAVVPMGCEAEDFSAFLPLVFRLRNIAGALITMPHKVVAAGLMDEVSDTVRICGACNAVRRERDGRLTGEMFDGEGFVAGLRRRGRDLRGVSVLMAGAGGVGSAIAAALANAGIGRLALFDIDPGLADGLASRLAVAYPALDLVVGNADAAGHQIIVNATPMGMYAGDALPVDLTGVAADALVGDVVLRPDTPLLSAARLLGCETQPGTDMLFEQIPAYLDFFGLPLATPDELRALAEI